MESDDKPQKYEPGMHPNSRVNLVKLGTDKQPSSEKRAEGWQRRKRVARMLQKINEYLMLSLSEMKARIQEIGEHPENYSVEDALMARYVEGMMLGADNKLLLDWIDRNIPKAPTQLTNDEEDEAPFKIIVDYGHEGNDAPIPEGGSGVRS